MEKMHMEQMYEKYSDTVFRTAYSIVKNISEAEDITSDVFIKFFTYEKEFENEEHEKAWLIRITINKCKDMFRSFRIKNRVTLDSWQAYCETEEESAVFDAVMKLPEKYRIVIHLFYFEGYSTDEIAEMIKVRGQTVRTRLSRARNMLKKSLGEELCL
ncbi:MAG: sigma-70 family RNA polymerase sigma factor [Oscillospiraceae bacterium]|nr:sigma-70 family RNA polymerase sigma factor [Oscillospiraceae bacterium]